MVKRKEVKIDEEQIRRVMTGDIPDAVLKNICDDNDTGSPKEDGKEPETKPNRDSCRACRGEEYRHICQGRSTLSGLTGENTPKKKHPSGYERLNHPLNSFTSFVAISFFHLSVRHPARGAGTLVSLNALQPFSLRKSVKARQEKIPERGARG